MNLFEKVSEYTYDLLIVAPDYPVLKKGIGLKRGQGILKRGSLIVQGSDGNAYIAGTTEPDVTMEVFGILSDDVDTGKEDDGSNIPVTCYITGIFNKKTILLKEGDIAKYETEMKRMGMYLRTVQEC